MEEFKIVEYKKADGNINVFYHIFSGKLIFISGNQELVNAIIQRNKNTDLLFEIDGLKHNITNFVKNLIPATNKNIAEIKKKIPIKTDVAIFSAMLDSVLWRVKMADGEKDRVHTARLAFWKYHYRPTNGANTHT